MATEIFISSLFDHVRWPDETKTELFGYNDKRYIWKKMVEALKPPNSIPTVTYGGVSIMLWVYFAAEGHFPLPVMRKENDVKQHLE